MIVFMLIIAIYSIYLLVIVFRIKFNKWSSKFVAFIKDTKLMCRKLKSMIKYTFRIRKFNLKKLKVKLYKFKLELLESPLSIIIMLSFAIMFLTLFLPSVITEKSAQEKCVIIAFVSFVIFVFSFTIINVQTSKTLASLRIFYLYLASPVIAISGIYLLIFLNGTLKLGISSVFMSITFFVAYAFFTFYICHRDLKSKFFRFALSLPIYLSILLFSSFIFGAYYYSVFKDLGEINSTNAIVIIKKCTKLGFRFFYSYIDGTHYTIVTLCQYYFGKLLDIFMLGFVFYKITEKEISNNKDSDREDLKSGTNLIKKRYKKAKKLK